MKYLAIFVNLNHLNNPRQFAVIIVGIVANVGAVVLLEGVLNRIVRVATELSLPTVGQHRHREDPTVRFAGLARFLSVRVVSGTTYGPVQVVRHGSRIDDPRPHVTASVQLPSNRTV